ncbi:hypothetical protein HPP92_005340 [Vanilla planifolia]|uniref:Protein SQS1 n=1 Tax=Vanilla planifolia TaxID=51239 RepID=A0A835RU91_VANPL|nr:hypothetical protein HPP92_005340 [Vanilla planifolia]
MVGGSGGRRRSTKRNLNQDFLPGGGKKNPEGAVFSFSRHRGSVLKASGSIIDGSLRRGHAFNYAYPEYAEPSGVDGPDSDIFVSSAGETSNTAFIDRDLYSNPLVEVPTHECNLSIADHVGLGYRGEEEDENEEAVAMESEGEALNDLETYSTPATKKEKFLMIGGVRIYTEDSSSPDEDVDGVEDDDSVGETTPNSDELNSSYSEEEEILRYDNSSDCTSDLDSGSDIDEGLAEDYVEGIGGSSELLNSKWLKTANLSDLGEGLLVGSGGDTNVRGGDELGLNALMNASMEYGMKKPKSRKGKDKAKLPYFGTPVVDIEVAGNHDLLFVKDSRSASRKKYQKRQSSHLSLSWPGEAQKSKKYNNYNYSGGKKKHHKELIAKKRRQRMINRGVDLDQINKKLREVVMNDVDMFSFLPMHSRDCSQVQRLASVYQLRSGCQGSGKKRFVTVTRTERTSLPSSKDKDRLDKLLGIGTEEDFVVSSCGMSKGRTKANKKWSSTPGLKQRREAHSSALNKLANQVVSCGKKKQSSRQPYAENPVSFVSCGIMRADSAAELIAADSIDTKTEVEVTETTALKLGAFEVHTKGFGSRMMAKMGFVEGSGLGKSGQGMVHPIEAIKRPKSLGLGIEFAESSAAEVRVERDQVIGAAFEKHTKGFGSKMMAKMGFVPGSGLGKDAQGAIAPLTAIRRPRSRGLGAT